MHFADPSKNVQELGLRPGMIVADMGAGSGFYSLEAAQAVGKEGIVYAIDIQKELLLKLSKEAALRHLSNIEIICGDVEAVSGTKLKDACVDALIISNILFQTEKKNALLTEAYRILKPGGSVLFVEWSDSFDGLGPQQKDIVSPEAAQALFAAAGFVSMRRFKAGAHHYGFLVLKETSSGHSAA